ncbi:MAG TPA: T9SS type A sorting domain-containing protein [bacterium]
MPILLLCCCLFNYVYQDADSLLVSNNDSLVICGVHNYNLKVHLVNGGRLRVRPGSAVSADTLGWLMLHANTIHIHDSSMIYGTGLGFPGGTNSHSDGWGPGAGQSGTSGGGGGAGYGGVGGDGGDTNPGIGGPSYGDPIDTIIERGSGGGAGRLSQVEGWGGNGGARVYLKARRVIIDSSGIMANGANGADASMEDGGGGSGGGILIRTDTLTSHLSSLYADGGYGGSASFGGGGGAGGGRIKLLYSTVLDTTDLAMSVDGGSGGTGGYGDGENGSSGSIYVGSVIAVEEVLIPGPQRNGTGSLATNLWPNPTSGLIYLEPRAIGPGTDLVIFDRTGRIVPMNNIQKSLAASHAVLDLSKLENGVYFICLNQKVFYPVVLAR